MVTRGLFVGLMLLALGLFTHATAAEKSPVTSINKSDHAGLVTYYSHEAKELREKATHWDMIAETYDKHQEPAGASSAAEHAAHCRNIAKDYRQAADEADGLAREHRAMLPHGKVQ